MCTKRISDIEMMAAYLNLHERPSWGHYATETVDRLVRSGFPSLRKPCTPGPAGRFFRAGPEALEFVIARAATAARPTA